MGREKLLKDLLKICLTLLQDEYALVELSSLIEEPKKDLRQQKNVNHIHKRRNIGWELRMNGQIGNYDTDFIILDLGTYVNILTKQTWESMGKPKLVWYHV